MDQQQKLATSLSYAVDSGWKNRYLILLSVKRDLVGRYRGSFAGLAWSFIQPVLMLAVYTFVFSTVFKASWKGAAQVDKAGFALILFAGLIVHNFVSECANRAPGVILAHVNYVKKIVFPLEILPCTIVGSALFHALVNVAVLVGAYAILNGRVHWQVLWLPVVAFPLVVGLMGIMWLLSSLGVFVRDVAQAMQPITTILLFLTPIFYPLSALPEAYQFWLLLNPLTYFVEEFRNLLLWGRSPDWHIWAANMAGGLLVAWAGFWWFQRTRRAFADVL